MDGTVRLWTLDGKPAAAPFKGHDGRSERRLLARRRAHRLRGQDGTVRLWKAAAGMSSVWLACADAGGLGFVGAKFFWIACSDRIRVESTDLEPRGELFLTNEGLAALVYGEGVYVSNDRLRLPFRPVVPFGQVVWQHGALPELSAQRVKQVLLDDWTLRERIVEAAAQTYARGRKALDDLGWWNAAFWPALAWALAILVALVTWIAAPHLLARWAMRSTGRPAVPTWKWLSDILLMFGYLGTTRRPLEAWLRKHRAALMEQTFTGREPVKERERYADLSRKPDIERLAAAMAARSGARVWITGTGGSGKSALAYRILRAASERNCLPPCLC